MDELQQLYLGIHNCKRCPSVFPSLAPREVIKSASDSEIVLVAQAPSEAGVRKSGLHWVGCDRKLRRPGGVFLDKYLRLIGYSVDPREQVYPRPYTTNVLHCWTGRRGKRDRKPSPIELSNCKSWLLKEFEIIKPKVMILLGKPAADSFACTYGESLSFPDLLARQGEMISFGELPLFCFVLPHPSAPYPGKSELYSKVIQQIGGLLRV
jgi:uracil-DNA glycosylase family 4